MLRSLRILALAALLVSQGCGLMGGGNTATVERGPFRTTLTETGELRAVSYAVIPCPHYDWSYGQATILSLEPEGTSVSRGDVVGMLDTALVVKALRQKEDERSIAIADYNKLVADHTNRRMSMEGQIHGAEGKLSRAAIDTQRTLFESESRRRLSKLGYRSASLAREKLRIQYETLVATQQDERIIKEAQIRRLESDIGKAQRTLDTFTLRAPADGLVEHFRRRNNKVQVGDRVWPSYTIIGLPDLSRMKALTSVAETDGDKVYEGQPVSVSLDAFPDRVFDAEVTFVSLISRPKVWNEPAKVFDVELALADTDPILKPGMTISAEFEVASLDSALLVPGDCIYSVSGGGYKVVVETMFGRKDVHVDVLYRNPRRAVVEGNLSEGDRLIRRPTDAG